jgi:hypothetical protein
MTHSGLSDLPTTDFSMGQGLRRPPLGRRMRLGFVGAISPDSVSVCLARKAAWNGTRNIPSNSDIHRSVDPIRFSTAAKGVACPRGLNDSFTCRAVMVRL